MTKDTEINNYLIKGIVEANLSFSKDMKNPFSLVKFEYKVDLTDAYSFKDFISFIHIYTDFSPILKQGKDSFLIFLKDTRVHQAKATINKLAYECNNKFNIDIKDIGITLSSPNDTYKTLMDRVDKYFVMSKLSSSKKIFYGTVDFDYYDTIDPLKVLQNIFNKSSHIILNNLYRCIPVQSGVRVSGFSDGIIQVKISTDKIPFYENEKFTFIQHDMIPDIIKASILKVDKNRFLMVLGNLQFLRSSPVERSSIRIKPNKNIHAILAKAHKKLAEGNIVSISENSISLKIVSEKAKVLTSSDLFQKELEIKFLLANDKKFLSPIKVKAYIFNIIDDEIILNISPDNSERNRIRDYISIQQNELLTALKLELKK
ncbi:MAG: hypothetical protein QM482_05915 [Sulfurospirillum sp.]